MNVTILGASGKTGIKIVTQALAAGLQVTAVVRDAEAFPSPTRP
jgi:putative NADH-flavin reductase